ncbi:Cellulase (glycosyl hydrolase family 5) [Gracilimonas mengyeensis]|uniref:Cellulase (Glycosyl hydrolase family 5) n=2 Tax=Gracilimonas mengyeensis TaxID=1302730 RepID=A0A521AXZ5_9BACT|nr:Cellulase (glycosyl hydrolase family 5) [Gracilimonas mengyeensis]
MRSATLSILFFSCFLLSPFSTLTAQKSDEHPLPFISVDGNRFVDENGYEFRFRGVSSSDPGKLKEQGKWTLEYFEAIKSYNANVVRFPVHPSAWRERGQENYLKLLDQGIEWAGKLGMYVIIDWHSIGNLRTEVYQSEMYNTTKTESFRFWRTIAARYKENPVVAFYETFNEPTTYHGQLGTLTWAEMKKLHEEMIGIIYAHDKTVIPLVSGLNWSYDLSPVVENPIKYPGVAYVTHPYPQKREQPWEEKWQDDWGFVAETYPVVATELGFMSEDGPGAHVPVIGDETYGNAIIDFFEERGISWVAWVFDPQWSPQMFKNWEYEPTMQGKFFKEKMGELNK